MKKINIIRKKYLTLIILKLNNQIYLVILHYKYLTQELSDINFYKEFKIHI